MSRSPQAEMLARAAGCYQRANFDRDAVRCYESAGEFATAGRLHEQAGRLAEAARCYERGNDWRTAAECHRRRRDPSAAADCLVRANDPLYAAWVLAEEGRQFIRARQLAEAARAPLVPGVNLNEGGPPTRSNTWSMTTQRRGERPDTPDFTSVATHELGHSLGLGLAMPLAAQATTDFDAVRAVVLARCDLGLHRPDPAARRLDSVIDRLPSLGPAVNRHQAIDWALGLAAQLERPDLGSLIHAACYRAGMPGAVARWEAWAIATLGDAFGVPIEDAEPPPHPASRGLKLDRLEERMQPAINLQFDYSYDGSGFFTDPARRATAADAARSIAGAVDPAPPPT